MFYTIIFTSVNQRIEVAPLMNYRKILPAQHKAADEDIYHPWTMVGRSGAMVESIPFNGRVVGSNTTLAAT